MREEEAREAMIKRALGMFYESSEFPNNWRELSEMVSAFTFAETAADKAEIERLRTALEDVSQKALLFPASYAKGRMMDQALEYKAEIRSIAQNALKGGDDNPKA